MEKIKKISKFRHVLLIGMDFFCVIFAYYLGTVVAEDSIFNFSKNYFQRLIFSTIGFMTIYEIIFHLTKRHKNIIRYEEGKDYMIYMIICLISAILLSIIKKAFHIPIIATVKMNILAGFLIAMLMIAYRVVVRYMLINDIINKGIITKSSECKKRLLIIGAGNAAHEIIKTISTNFKEDYEIIGIIDDNKNRLNFSVSGIKIIGNRNDILNVCKENEIDLIFFSIARIDPENKKQILNICQQTQAKVRVLPGIREIINNKDVFSSLRDVEIEDILGREPVKLDNTNIQTLIQNRTILVTGGGGSIGSELCRQIMHYNPERLVILDIYENNLYDIELELKKKYPQNKIYAVVASVRDKKRLQEVFEAYHPYLVFHAAAHKHVPLMEHSPLEAIKNNIFGTYHVINTCDEFQVRKCILISTDKAVNPTNIMGATKRMCEMMIQAKNQESKTEYAAVRFGNVLGSNGSVVPLFKKQIERRRSSYCNTQRNYTFFYDHSRSNRISFASNDLC